MSRLPHTATPTKGRKSVLVAMANPSKRYEYSRCLAVEGFDVANVSDAFACLDALRCRPFDLLVVEEFLPWGHGDGVVEVIHSDPEIHTIPVILVEVPSRTSPGSVGVAAPHATSRCHGVEELLGVVRRIEPAG